MIMKVVFHLGLVFGLYLMQSCAQQPTSLVVGWEGDGKSYFKHKFDSDTGTFRELNAFGSIGLRAGFGDSVKDLDGKEFNSIVWIVPCTEVVTKSEALDFIQLLLELVGTDVPITAVFNPMHEHNVCTKNVNGFISSAAAKNIQVKKVYTMDSFDTKEHFAEYSKPNVVKLPARWTSMLDEKDPVKSAEKLKKYRDMGCDSIPTKLQENRNQQTANANTRRDADSYGVASCSKRGCSIPQPGLENCSETFCAAHGKKCGRVLGFKGSCSHFCARYETRQRGDCVNRNNERMDGFRNALSQCEASAQHDFNDCEATRTAQIQTNRDHNAAIETTLQALRESESKLKADLAICQSDEL